MLISKKTRKRKPNVKDMCLVVVAVALLPHCLPFREKEKRRKRGIAKMIVHQQERVRQRKRGGRERRRGEKEKDK